MGTSILTKIIQDQMKLLWDSQVMSEWREENKIKNGDLIIVNNSFILRKSISTSKNSKYLVFKKVSKNRSSKGYQTFVIDWNKSINLDFKKISSRSKNKPELLFLPKIIDQELNKLGYILFTLIGKTVEEEPCKVEIKDKSIKSITWDTRIDDTRVIDDAITIHDPYSSKIIETLESKLNEAKIDTSDGKLLRKIEDSLETIKREATTVLEIPKKGDELDKNFLSEFINSVESEISTYKQILGSDDLNINELLRISYNFIDDGLSLYKLICSICDLKPIILWGTIYHHFNHNQVLSKIPQIVPGTKVSLKEYEKMIRDARNQKFHRLVNFKRTLEINLPEDAIKKPKLIIFGQHGQRTNEFKYEDQELVDLLLNFRRTKEMILHKDFWSRNYEVMKATFEIFEQTEEFMKLLLT